MNESIKSFQEFKDLVSATIDAVYADMQGCKVNKLMMEYIDITVHDMVITYLQTSNKQSLSKNAETLAEKMRFVSRFIEMPITVEDESTKTNN